MALMTAVVTLQEDLKFRVEAGSGHALTVDGPLDAYGGNAGFRPMELMLMSLGGCMALDVLLVLRRMRQEVTAYQVRLTGERAEEPPAVYTAVTLEHVIAGPRLGKQSVERALKLAEDKYCSAWAMISRTARLTNRYRIEGAQ